LKQRKKKRKKEKKDLERGLVNVFFSMERKKERKKGNVIAFKWAE
tara:strand:- start:322 stop:456 length:135 start_codon:yes stop_codon:yes gene_type:complete